jgi:hypothetical protein
LVLLLLLLLLMLLRVLELLLLLGMQRRRRWRLMLMRLLLSLSLLMNRLLLLPIPIHPWTHPLLLRRRWRRSKRRRRAPLRWLLGLLLTRTRSRRSPIPGIGRVRRRRAVRIMPGLHRGRGRWMHRVGRWLRIRSRRGLLVRLTRLRRSCRCTVR